MNKLHISPQVRADLAEIKGYISQDLASPKAAVKLVSKILNRIKYLKEFSELGASLSSIIQIDTNYRYLLCAQYMVFYRCEENKNVFVDRVLYGRCDFVSVLFGEDFEKTEKMLNRRLKIIKAEKLRLNGEAVFSLDDAKK